jgi:hypothetical protein
MLTPRQSGPSRTAASARNLFLDADPDEHALAPERSQHHRARASRPSRQRRHGRGLLTPVGSSSSPTAAGRDAATFTRTRLGAASWPRRLARGFAARTLAQPHCFADWRTARTGASRRRRCSR